MSKWKKTRKGVELGGYGVAYREDYPLTGYSHGGGRVGRAQFYRRNKRGKFASRGDEDVDFPFNVPTTEQVYAGGRMLGERVYAALPEGGGQYKYTGGLSRSIRIMVTGFMIVIAFVAGIYIMNLIVDLLLTMGDVFGVTAMTQLASMRTYASLALGITACLAALIIGILLFFREEEVNDSVLEVDW
jgi:hypothetical protein